MKNRRNRLSSSDGLPPKITSFNRRHRVSSSVHNGYRQPLQPLWRQVQHWQQLVPWSQLLGILLIGAFIFAASQSQRLSNLPTVQWNDSGMALDNLYATKPNIQQCQAGRLKTAEAEKVLRRLNEIRRLHQLPPVQYALEKEDNATQVALVHAANPEELGRSPAIVRCGTPEINKPQPNQLGYSVHYSSAGSSSPAYDLVQSEHLVDAPLQDGRDEGRLDELSARRILLDPFLQAIAFARVDGSTWGHKIRIPDKNGQMQEKLEDYITASTIITVPTKTQPPGTAMPHLVAYPFGNYPKDLFQKDEYRYGYPFMSLSIVADQAIAHNNTQPQIDVSTTQIQITNPEGKIVPVTNLRADYQNYGLGNSLSWNADDIQLGVKYTVQVKNVRLSGTSVNYDYWFRLK